MLHPKWHSTFPSATIDLSTSQSSQDVAGGPPAPFPLRDAYGLRLCLWCYEYSYWRKGVPRLIIYTVAFCFMRTYVLYVYMYIYIYIWRTYSLFRNKCKYRYIYIYAGIYLYVCSFLNLFTYIYMYIYIYIFSTQNTHWSEVCLSCHPYPPNSTWEDVKIDVNDVLKKGFRPKGYHVAPWFWNEDGKIVYIYRLNNIYIYI